MEVELRLSAASLGGRLSAKSSLRSSGEVDVQRLSSTARGGRRPERIGWNVGLGVTHTLGSDSGKKQFLSKRSLSPKHKPADG